MRVPLGALTLMTNWPGSVRGKKATPRKGDSARLSTNTPMMMPTVILGLLERVLEKFVVLAQHVIVAAIKRREHTIQPSAFVLAFCLTAVFRLDEAGTEQRNNGHRHQV